MQRTKLNSAKRYKLDMPLGAGNKELGVLIVYVELI
jgi:hypothetical protein